MHLIVGNMANLAEVDWVDDLIEPIFLVSIEVLGLTAVTCWSQKLAPNQEGRVHLPE
jgi:hypothetical protein